jgi:hypothetical protein
MKQNEHGKEYSLGYSDRRTGCSAKAKHRGNECNDQERRYEIFSGIAPDVTGGL